MTAVITTEHKTIDCPHCKGKLNVEIEREPHTVKIQQDRDRDIEGTIERILEKKLPKAEPTKEEKPKEIEVPSYLPKHFCNNPDGCEGHDNKKRMKVTKRCADGSCLQVAPKRATKCSFCGGKEFDELDDDEIERFNKGMEHDHERE